jgi:hypothetical protein
VAIAYKSQGAGVSTETSGAALSPLCPAVVDAGDILIGHVFWESNVSAPATPSGWTLLYGPALIETSVARHWVFGKIAAGTEDGAAVAFGAPAVTTQRAARIYSFSGRVAGTITELVAGFSETSHATDPQMPTVATTMAGALAVALVAQNDNNAFVSPTGETGGDWVEAVAEYTVALTPGFSLGIETCTPTANPGTVTGGTMATTNDPCGVIGFQIKESNFQNVAAGVGEITLVGFAPAIETPINIATGVGEIVLTGYAPVITIESAGSSVNVTPGVGELTLEGYAPTVETPKNIQVGIGEIVITGFAPTIETPVLISTGLGQLTLEGYAPNIVVSDHENVLSGVGQVIIEGFAPVIETPRNITPDTGTVVLSGYEPLIQATDHKIITPGTGEIVVDGYTPTVNIGVITNSLTGEMLIDGYAPTVSVSEHAVTSPQTGTINIEGHAPLVTISQVYEGTPYFGGIIIQGFAPTINITSNDDNIVAPLKRRKAEVINISGGFSVINRRAEEEDEEIFAVIQTFLQCLK